MYKNIKVPLFCFPSESFKKRVILSEGMAKEIPAATFSVLIPITSPSLQDRNQKEKKIHIK